ncbi:hypothetical protein OE09_1498 [Flavobacteriaceae bacterium MAR_2010_72]|nr:hypothetical protein OE09_1498 [Flavobacteriaceae bacterium MAR_2010_72]TVZ59778.1 hypothetical protein NA63_2315 [Flavobacteriaceae bacterium MAR_2010_105]
MKYLIYICSFLMFTGLYAQEKPVDKMKETKVKTTKTKKDGKVVENKVKVITTTEQKVTTDPKLKDQRDSPRIKSPIKVTEQVVIDNDKDPFYDKMNKTVYYKNEDNPFAFKTSTQGFIISSSDNPNYATARRLITKNYYLLTTDTNYGVGYFDGEGNFVYEYFDEEEGKIVVRTFSSSDSE